MIQVLKQFVRKGGYKNKNDSFNHFQLAFSKIHLKKYFGKLIPHKDAEFFITSEVTHLMEGNGFTSTN